MSVEYLLNRCFPVQSGQDVLFYAASGGVGLIAGQWGKYLGANMIGVTTGDDKLKLALSHGYTSVIDRRLENIPEKVRSLTNGRGVAVAYDSVGKDSFEHTLTSLAPRGFFVTFGATTGSLPSRQKFCRDNGSLYYTRPTLATYIAERKDLLASAATVFDPVETGVLKPVIGQRYLLADAAKAHRDLEAGTTRGSSVIMPEHAFGWTNFRISGLKPDRLSSIIAIRDTTQTNRCSSAHSVRIRRPDNAPSKYQSLAIKLDLSENVGGTFLNQCARRS